MHSYDVYLQARSSDPFHTYGVYYSFGETTGAGRTFLAPFVTWRFRDRLTLGLSSSLLRHKEDRFQHIFTFNYDLSSERGFGGRVISQTGGTNGYLAFRHSGYGGGGAVPHLRRPERAEVYPPLYCQGCLAHVSEGVWHER